MFQELEEISSRPEPFEVYSARDLWTDEYISGQMLRHHLDETGSLASRTADFIDRSVAWIVSKFDVSSQMKVADFGCGPGLYSSRLARAEARVTGIDFSPRSIQHAVGVAEREGLSIQYVNRDYLEFETEERFDLILMITCDFCALSPAQRQQLLSRFFRFLKPGGSVLLDVYSIAAFDARQETAGYEVSPLDGFWSPYRYYEFLNTFKYKSERVVLDKYTIIEADRVRTIYNWFQYFDPESIEEEFSAAGLEICGLYADVAGSTFDSELGEFALVAEKPAI